MNGYEYEDDLDAILRDPFASAALGALLVFLFGITIPYLATGYRWEYEWLVILTCAPVFTVGVIGSTVRHVRAHLTARRIEAYRSHDADLWS